MMQNEISLAIECGVLSEPAGIDVMYTGTKLPINCGEHPGRLCNDCQLGVPYHEIPECPICGAAFSLLASVSDVAGSVFPKFTCGTILNVCRRQPRGTPGIKHFVTSISIGAGCHDVGSGEDVI